MAMSVPLPDYASLYEEAKKHSTYETFRDAMLHLSENIWHQARGNDETKADNSGKETGNVGHDDVFIPPVTSTTT